MRRFPLLCILSLILLASCAAKPAVNQQSVARSSSPGPCMPYVLDRDAFTRELAAAKGEDARLGVMARRWEAITRAVAYCNAALGPGPGEFHRSSMYWYTKYVGGEKIESKGNLDKPAELEKGGGVIIRGDCLADVTVKGHAFIHVYGDLNAKITTTSNVQCEIVIGGDIKPGAMIDDDGIVTIFVGGNMSGDLQNRGSAFIWINGDLNGTVETGSPATSLHVMGDFNGMMKPLNQGALESLDVRGFMSAEKIDVIARMKHTEFQASIGFSDQPPGLYPHGQGQPELVRWVIHAQRVPGKIAN
ncbi:MAG TPA: hypothetical protein VMV94_01620 [Phycisphaerae bacterium]|nr:hypothetical protein [Phycisphaerae bacterium]